MNPRGILPNRLHEAAELAQARIRALMEALGEMTQGPGGVFGGDAIRRQDHYLLLARDPNYQQEVLAKYPFATPREQEAIRRDLVRAMQLYPDALPEPIAGTAHLLPQVPAGPAQPLPPEDAIPSAIPSAAASAGPSPEAAGRDRRQRQRERQRQGGG